MKNRKCDDSRTYYVVIYSAAGKMNRGYIRFDASEVEVSEHVLKLWQNEVSPVGSIVRRLVVVFAAGEWLSCYDPSAETPDAAALKLDDA